LPSTNVSLLLPLKIRFAHSLGIGPRIGVVGPALISNKCYKQKPARPPRRGEGNTTLFKVSIEYCFIDYIYTL
jgi:hypothetical protein